jgi:hypothetical protein
MFSVDETRMDGVHLKILATTFTVFSYKESGAAVKFFQSI